MIHGDTGQQNLDLFAVSQKALPLLSKKSQLQMQPDVSHSFLENIDGVIALARSWYKNYFPLA